MGSSTCDKNICSPHYTPQASGDTEEPPVNRAGMVKTIYLPSFNSANFSPFTTAEALGKSDISAVPKINQQPNSCGGTLKNIMSSSYSNLMGQLRKNINRSPNAKPVGLLRMFVLVLQKDGRDCLLLSNCV